MNSIELSTTNGFDGVNEFRVLAEKLVEFGDMAGCSIVPYSHPSLPHFSALSSDKKVEVVSRLKLFVEICEATINSGKELSDSKSLTWFALKKLDLRFPSEMFELIGDNDLVELYDKDNIQVFRNFRFMELVSYTLEDFYCRPWTDLFYRPEPEKAVELLKVIKKIFGEGSFSVHNMEWQGQHRVEEVDSALKNKYEAVFKHLCPIYTSDKQPFGCLSIADANLLNRRTDREMGELVEKHSYLSTPRKSNLHIVS